MTTVASVRIGTRGSALALAQATMVRDALEAAGVPTELTIITTEGDRRAPDTAWGEGAFVSAIESKLVSREVDAAVHSAKDVPTDEDPRLAIAAFLERAPSGDVVVMPLGHQASSLAELAQDSRVGTDSPRRTAFLRALRPDLRLHPLHGNVDTRLRRLDEGQSDALVLAEAGLTRLGRADRISFRLAPEGVPPAPGQGAVAVQVRSDDPTARALVGRLDHAPTRAAVELERSVLAASGGGCRAPLGVNASLVDGRLEVLAGFARPDGTLAVVRRASGSPGDSALVDRILDDLAVAGGRLAIGQPWPRVIVTRAREQSSALALAMIDRGLAPLVVPTISIEPAGDGLHDALGRLASFDWIVVTSSNAARAVASRPESRVGLVADRPRWAAVGLATARSLRSAGIPVAFRPTRSSGRDLATTLPLEAGSRILVPRSDLADDALVDALRERGAEVEAVIAYRTVEAPPASEELLRIALQERPAAVIATSGSTIRGLLTLAARTGAEGQIRGMPVICIGAETAREAARLGLTVAATAASQAVGAIAEATAGYLRRNQES